MISTPKSAKRTVEGIILRYLLAITSAFEISRNNGPKQLWNINTLPQEEKEDESDTDSDTWTNQLDWNIP